MKYLLLAIATTGYGQNLEAALAAATPNGVAYVGYEMPMQPGHGTVCSNWNGGIQSYQSKLMLDGPRTMKILFKVDNGKVEKFLLASEDCVLDPGAQKVVMLSNITAEASIRYLASRDDDSSLYAISLHRDPQATQKLIEMARDGQNAKRQKKAFFWLARSKDPEAQKFILRVLR